jgi:hypothetical protein
MTQPKTTPLMRWTFYLLTILSLGLCSCGADLTEIEDPNYDPVFAIPLVNSNTTIKKLVEGSEDLTSVVVGSNGQLHFLYRGDVLTRTSDQIFGQLTSALPPLVPITSKNMPLPLALPNGVKLKKVELKAGDFSYYLENPNTEPIKVKLTLPELTKGGQAMTFNIDLPAYSGSGARPSASNQVSPASFEGYTFVPKNDSLYIKYEATTSSGRSVNAALFVIRIVNLKFSYAEGFFGSLLYEGGKDTVSIDFFKNYIQGNIYFADPKVSFFLENSFGVPSRSIVKDFRVFTVGGKVLPVQSPIIRTGIDFPYPRLNEAGQAKRDTFVFDKSNSNLDVLLGSGPTAVAYDVDAFTNPDGNTGQSGFITDKSYYKVQVEVDLPLYGRATNFISDQIYGIDFSAFKRVENLEFKIVAENETPIEARVQGYFLDDAGKTLDSLFSGKQLVLKGAATNAQGFPTGNVSQTTFTTFDDARFQKIRLSKRMRLSLVLSTDIANPDKVVRLLAQQQIKVRIGAKVGL